MPATTTTPHHVCTIVAYRGVLKIVVEILNNGHICQKGGTRYKPDEETTGYVLKAVAKKYARLHAQSLTVTDADCLESLNEQMSQLEQARLALTSERDQPRDA